MKRALCLAYGIACYLAFQAVFLYLLGFLANFGVPKSIDGGASASPGVAIGVDIALIALFGLQHSIMARPAFKRRWTRWVSAAIERSTYVLATALVLALLFAAWIPIDTQVWHLELSWLRASVWAVFGAGVALCLAATFMIDHADLFGLRQIWCCWRGRAYRPTPFQVSWLYKWIRHPLYLGFLLVFWATPDMSLGHLVFALGMSAYLAVGARLEERDLMTHFGASYAKYRESVPMLVPRPGRRCPLQPLGASMSEKH